MGGEGAFRHMPFARAWVDSFIDFDVLTPHSQVIDYTQRNCGVGKMCDMLTDHS